MSQFMRDGEPKSFRKRSFRSFLLHFSVAERIFLAIDKHEPSLVSRSSVRGLLQSDHALDKKRTRDERRAKSFQ